MDVNVYLVQYPQQVTFSEEDAGAVFDRYHAPDFVMCNDGILLDREKLLAHVRPARKRAKDIRVEVHETVSAADRVAARYTLTADMATRQDDRDPDLHVRSTVGRRTTSTGRPDHPRRITATMTSDSRFFIQTAAGGVGRERHAVYPGRQKPNLGGSRSRAQPEMDDGGQRHLRAPHCPTVSSRQSILPRRVPFRCCPGAASTCRLDSAA